MNIFLSAGLILVFLYLTEGSLTTLPPRITSVFKKEYWLAEDVTSTLSLPCQAEGDPAPTYTWYFEGRPITSSEDRPITEGTLRIIKTKASYFGKYQCFAENKNGKTMTPELFIKEADLKLFDDQTVYKRNIKKFGSIGLKCQDAPKCVPKEKCKFEWKIGEGTEGSVESDARIAVDAKGTLHFLYTLPTDATTESVPYACGVSNEIMGSFNKGSLTALSVSNDESMDRNVKKVFVEDVTAELGGQAVLQCVFSGEPLPVVTWYKGETQIIPSSGNEYSYGKFKNQLVNQRKLIIDKVKESHGGTYKCLATQRSGGRVNTADGQVVLSVIGPPQFTEVMSHQVKPVGSRAVFKCKTRSLASMTAPNAPIWFENAERLTQFGDSNQKFSKSADSTELYINNLQKSYTTTIQCSVENSFGSSNTDSYLVVIDKTVITAEPPSEIKLLPGSKESLYVNATTDPQFTLSYSWSFTDTDGKVVEAKDFDTSLLVLTDNNRNLTIDASNLKGDEIFKVVGDYKVKISHTYDTKFVSVNITTDSSIVKPGGQTVQAAGFDSWLFAVIGGIIFLIIVIVLIVCLLHRNRGGDYNVDKKELAAGHDPAKELENGGLHELSRAYDDHNPTDDRLSLTDNIKDLSSDDEDYREYDLDDDTGKFNEDGSFIGQYGDKHLQHPTQSTV